MKLVVQNLQKRSHSATDLVKEYEPDVLLAQEFSLTSEDQHIFPAHFTSKRSGYGTAIYGKQTSAILNVRHVESPHAEVGGFIHKKTTIAEYMGVEFVSFHGYNGQPIKNLSKLVDHVNAVLSVVSTSGPAVFAGDFNTWTQAHLDGVKVQLEKADFHLARSWPYPGRDFPLDHIFVRGMCIEAFATFRTKSDHNGALFELHPITQDT
jgi:endonuclease/exonuclease/phosphatase (EEP) superfamily protein YafD